VIHYALNHTAIGDAMIAITTFSAMLATIRDRRAAHTLALYRAKNRVKEELRRHNIKLQSLTAREIAVWAALYLEDNRRHLQDLTVRYRAQIKN
jgi:hypothetical protein